MRFLLSTLLIITATGLIAHGVYFENEARSYGREHENPLGIPVSTAANSSPNEVVRDDWPYTSEAVEARRALAEEWEIRRPQDPSPPLEDLILERIEGAFSTEAPYVDPYGAAVVALGALLIIVFLPRQRLRSLALLAFIIGAVVMFPAFLDPPAIGNMVEQASLIQYVVGYFPWIAVGLLLLAGLLAAAKRPREFDQYD